MDVRMGGLTGIETLQRLREFDSKTPVILMTAFGTTQTAIAAMKHGAYDYVLKPFDVPKLKELVANALAAARAMKQVVSYEPLLEKEDYDLGIIGKSPAMQEVFKTIGQLAASDATALIETLVSCRDLIDLGIKPGPPMGKLLNEIRDRQLAEEFSTREEALAWAKEKTAQ